MTPVSVAVPRCGAKTRDGGACRRGQGEGTPHPGQGRCWQHGGLTPIRHGRYSKLTRERVRELAESFESDPDPLNLLPELAQARALYQDYLERFDAHQKALFDWHASYLQGKDDAQIKPRQMLDAADAYRLLSEVTKIAARIENVRASNAISRPDFYRLMTEMGRVIDLVVTDPELRQRVHDAWLDIRLA